MAATTPEEFGDDVDQAFSWRRTEMQSLRGEVEKLDALSEVKPYGRMILRAGVALLYAHWEGFVKQTCQHYLDYVARRKLTYRQLNPPLAATSVRALTE